MESERIKILAIDDNQDNLISLKALIKEAFPDAKIFTALNGTKGLELAAAEDPDVILLDIIMPGMDGFEVCKKLKADKIQCDIPVVFVTAIKGDKEHRIHALEVGAEAFLAKPIDATELTAQIRAMVKIKTANNNKRDENERLAALVEKQTGELRKAYSSTLKLLEDLNRENKAREKSEEKFRAVAELSPIAIYASRGSDQQGIFINETFYKIFGFTMEDVPTVGVWWLKAFPDEKYRQQVIEQWVLNIEQAGKNNSDVEALECVCTCKDGSEKNIVWVGKTIGKEFWAFGYDFTERKNTEQELIIAKDRAEESDRLKSAFLANMSHEIRTPMNGILGFSELLKEPGLSGDEQLNYIQIIEKSGNRMLNIINDIVDISKIEAGLMKIDIRESNINEQIEYIYTFFKPEVEAKGMKLSFRNSLPSKESIIKTDREKLYAVLTNLVKNAIKYSEKGLIEFGYDVVETHGRASVHGHASLQIQFYVKDTGIGIPKDRQEAIFERFIQADITDMMARQGAGLGLSISKAYVEMLGGKIWVESEEDIGSTFYFTLPYNAEPVIKTVNQQSISSGKTEPIRKLKILIAEDDEASGMLIDITIKMLGKEIIKVRTGHEAVEACRINPDIDLILMDIKMPEMDGHEATKHIREFDKEVIIISQTAYGLSGDREKSIESGCNDYISKPH